MTSESLVIDKSGLNVSNTSMYNYMTARSNVGVCGGRWYWEVTLDTNQALVGVCLGSFESQQLGSNEKSWAYECQQGQKSYGNKNESYGDSYLSRGDVIGVLLDGRKLSFSRNGKSMGVAFSDLPVDQLLYPAVSLRRNQRVVFNFGAKAFVHPDSASYPFNVTLTDKQRKAIEKLFEHYQKLGRLSESQGGDDDDGDDVIRAEGVFQFATDAGAKDDNDPLLLIVASKLRGENPWQFTRDEWLTGFSLNGLHDIKQIRNKAAQWKEETFAGDIENFKTFYGWCFDYLKEDRKILSMEEVKLLWTMLDLESRWKLWPQWLAFLESKKREYLSRDEWNVLLTFLLQHPNGVQEVDEDSFWPVLFDEFVDFVLDSK